MPRISTEYLDEQRDWRRNQLLSVATEIIRESGFNSLTMTSVAKGAGISRTSTYEYFANTDDLLSNLLFDELKNFSHYLECEMKDAPDVRRRIECWIEIVVNYAVSQDHLFARNLFAMPKLKYRELELSNLHGQLYSSLRRALQEIGVRDVGAMERIIRSVVESAIQSVERGAAIETQMKETTLFILSGIEACSSSHKRIVDALKD